MITIDRTPIVGIRQPIIGVKRTPIVGVEGETSTEELQWDDVYSKLINYIKFASKQVQSQYQTGVNSSEDLFQEGQLLLYHCFQLYKRKPINEFSALFKASLWRKLREIGSKKSFIQIELEDAFNLGYSEETVEDLYNEHKLQQVANLLESSPIALTIFKEFVNPSSRTLWEAEMDVARRATLQNQGYNVSVPRTVRIKGVHIQRALEIPKVRFQECLKLVKTCVASVYFEGEEIEEFSKSVVNL